MGFGDVIQKEITVALKKNERAEYDHKAVELMRQIDNLKSEKASANADWNKDIKDLTKARLAAMDASETGCATVMVPCFWRLNDQLGQAELVRKDNGKIVPEYTRALSAEERQTGLFDGSEGDDGADDEEEDTIDVDDTADAEDEGDEGEGEDDGEEDEDAAE